MGQSVASGHRQSKNAAERGEKPTASMDYMSMSSKDKGGQKKEFK